MPITERHGNIQVDLLNDDLYIRRRDANIGIMIPGREVEDLIACIEAIAEMLLNPRPPLGALGTDRKDRP